MLFTPPWSERLVAPQGLQSSKTRWLSHSVDAAVQSVRFFVFVVSSQPLGQGCYPLFIANEMGLIPALEVQSPQFFVQPVALPQTVQCRPRRLSFHLFAINWGNYCNYFVKPCTGQTISGWNVVAPRSKTLWIVERVSTFHALTPVRSVAAVKELTALETHAMRFVNLRSSTVCVSLIAVVQDVPALSRGVGSPSTGSSRDSWNFSDLQRQPCL